MRRFGQRTSYENFGVLIVLMFHTSEVSHDNRLRQVQNLSHKKTYNTLIDYTWKKSARKTDMQFNTYSLLLLTLSFAVVTSDIDGIPHLLGMENAKARGVEYVKEKSQKISWTLTS